MIAATVVVPTYNRAAKLGRLLEALHACVPPAGGFEVVVVDDGSTDTTPGVVRAAKVSVVYERQANRGPAAARNRGWRVARGRLIAFIDDDCIPHPNWLVELVRASDDDPTIAGIGGLIQSMGDGFLDRFVTAERVVDHGRDAAGVRFLVTANAGYPRSVLEAVGGFDESFRCPAGEDVDLSYRIRASVGPLLVCETAVVAHDHRTTLRDLLGTYFRHGRGRVLLAARHSELSVSVGAQHASSARGWADKYQRYRAVTNPFEAMVYLCLRVVALGCFLAGTMVERWGWGGG